LEKYFHYSYLVFIGNYMKSTFAQLAGCGLLVLAGCACLLTGMNPGWLHRRTSAGETLPAGAIPQAKPAEGVIADEVKAPLTCEDSKGVCFEPDKNPPVGSP
jgi:hypothetical protein